VADDWRPTASAQAIALRARLNRLIREFFHARGVLEVETPILSGAGNTDPNIESFHLDFHGPASAGARRRWLRTSPEFPLKRLLAAGIGDCYELGRVFRNGEAGRRHNPEFTMLEWYRVGWDHRRLMRECAELVQAALALMGREVRVETLSYAVLFQRHVDLDPHRAGIDALRAPLQRFGIDPEGLERDDWLDLLLTHCIEPALDAGSITLIHDFPASQCALARLRPGEPPLAERFELYLGGVELANGYHELADPDEQRARFTRDLQRRAARVAASPALDQRLLAALEAGLPDCAGVALGVDRLLMAMLGTSEIGEVIAFPFARA
jgi:elongation factor P--(R)-beta-lysine ligase